MSESAQTRVGQRDILKKGAGPLALPLDLTSVVLHDLAQTLVDVETAQRGLKVRHRRMTGFRLRAGAHTLNKPHVRKAIDQQ